MVCAVLTVLNEDISLEHVSDELVDAVMQEADVTQDAGISKLELKCAIAAWYAEVRERLVFIKMPTPRASDRASKFYAI